MANNSNVVLFEPEIPQNTGNIIRLCANTGSKLHLIYPLGFVLNDKKMKRAGLDYHDDVEIISFVNWDDFKSKNISKRLVAIETSGSCFYDKILYTNHDMLIFGAETKGLPDYVLSQVDLIASIPMVIGQRSLNLSNSVSVVLYESWRQSNFKK